MKQPKRLFRSVAIVQGWEVSRKKHLEMSDTKLWGRDLPFGKSCGSQKREGREPGMGHTPEVSFMGGGASRLR